MKTMITALLCSVSVMLFAQAPPDNGVKYTKGLKWDEIKSKAKKENKYIFVDCYATWCKPCKWMDKNVFATAAVGEFMNEQFINIVVQMDKTEKDNDEVRQWHATAKNIEKEYKIEAFPTYLFFSPEGKVVHRIEGATNGGPSEFLNKAKNATAINTQYYTVINHYKEHLNDSVFLFSALRVSLDAKDSSNSSAIAECYLRSIKNPLIKERLELFYKVMVNTRSGIFSMFLTNAQQADSILGQGLVQWKLSSLISSEYLKGLGSEKRTPVSWAMISGKLKKKLPGIQAATLNSVFEQYRKKIGSELRQIYNDTLPADWANTHLYANFKPDTLIGRAGQAIYLKTPDWNAVRNRIKARYPDFDPDTLIAAEQPRYYRFVKQWEKYAATAIAYLNEYGNLLGDRAVNNIVWDIFFHSNDQSLLKEATKWSRKSVDMAPDNYQNIDTYSNLLYKTGNSDAAIEWEKKAIAMIEAGNKNDQKNLNVFKAVLDKMQKGQKTWQE